MDQSSLDGVRNNPTYARNFGNYPWTRSLWARVVEELAHHGARAVLFDMVMDERNTDPSVDVDFAAVLREHRPALLPGRGLAPEGGRRCPKVEPVHVPLDFNAPRPHEEPAATAGNKTPTKPEPEPPAGGADPFEELDDDQAQAPTDPLEAARALAFPARTDGRALPLMESESAPGLRERIYPVPPVAALLKEVDGFGLVEVEPDPDGLMRRTRFAYTDGANPYVTIPVALAADLFGAKELVFSGRTLRLGSREFEVNPDGSAEIDFGGTLNERFPFIPVIQLLDDWALRQQGKPPSIAPDLFRGRIVVVGGTAVGLGDNKSTPFAPAVPGVNKQLAVLDNLLAGRFITEAPFWVSLLFGLGLAVLSTVLLMTLRWPAAGVRLAAGARTHRLRSAGRLAGAGPGAHARGDARRGRGCSPAWRPWPPTTSSPTARPSSSARPSAGTWSPSSSSR